MHPRLRSPSLREAPCEARKSLHPASLVDLPCVSSGFGGGHTIRCIRVAPGSRSGRRENAGVAGAARLAGVALSDRRGRTLLGGYDARGCRSVPLSEMERCGEGAEAPTRTAGAPAGRIVSFGGGVGMSVTKRGVEGERVYIPRPQPVPCLHTSLFPPPHGVASPSVGLHLLKRSGDRGWGTTVKWLSGLSLCVCVRTCFVGYLSKAPLSPSRALLK